MHPISQTTKIIGHVCTHPTDALSLMQQKKKKELSARDRQTNRMEKQNGASINHLGICEAQKTLRPGWLILHRCCWWITYATPPLASCAYRLSGRRGPWWHGSTYVVKTSTSIGSPRRPGLDIEAITHRNGRVPGSACRRSRMLNGLGRASCRRLEFIWVVADPISEG